MFRTTGFFTPVPPDPFNWGRNRNVRNTRKYDYNCGGFALGTFSWYCPHKEDIDGYSNYCGATEIEISEITQRSINTMLADFKGRLRVISSVTEANLLTEYVIAFRIDPKGNDFHFVRRGCRGHWYHKRGARCEIEQMDEIEVFCEDWVFGSMHYNGPLVLFAMIRQGIKIIPYSSNQGLTKPLICVIIKTQNEERNQAK